MVISRVLEIQPAIRKLQFLSIKYSGLKYKKMFEIPRDKDLLPHMVSLAFQPHGGSMSSLEKVCK